MADPFPTCWLNGDFLPLAEARISPLDRGFLFADGAYEVVPVHRGRPFRLRQHLERFDRSLRELRIRNPLPLAGWVEVIGHARRCGERAGTARLPAGDARRGVRAQPPVSARVGRADGFRFRQPVPAAGARAARARTRRRHARGHALGALRHQVGRTARQRAAAPAGAGPGRLRSHSARGMDASPKARPARSSSSATASSSRRPTITASCQAPRATR